MVLERQHVTLTSLHFGRDSLTEGGPHALGFRVGVILDQAP